MSTEQRAVWRVLIADDEAAARGLLASFFEEEPTAVLVATCASGTEALARLRELQPDLAFLDVRMPGIDGVQVLQQLEHRDPPAVVFTTAHADYAVAAFAEEAVDFLLKPFDRERLVRAFERAKERVLAARARSAGVAEPGGGSSADAEHPAKLTIHREGHVEVVDLSEVTWIQSADQYVRLHTAAGEHLMRTSMGELERTLDPERFVRVHRSAIVDLSRVRRLESLGGGTGRLQLADSTWVPVSRSRVSAVRRRLG